MANRHTYPSHPVWCDYGTVLHVVRSVARSLVQIHVATWRPSLSCMGHTIARCFPGCYHRLLQQELYGQYGIRQRATYRSLRTYRAAP